MATAASWTRQRSLAQNLAKVVDGIPSRRLTNALPSAHGVDDPLSIILAAFNILFSLIQIPVLFEIRIPWFVLGLTSVRLSAPQQAMCLWIQPVLLHASKRVAAVVNPQTLL